MVDYQITVDHEQKVFIIKGVSEEGAVPIAIPREDPSRQQFIDYFLHKADIEKGIDFLQCISKDKNRVVNEGLFIAGLSSCIKCFQLSESRDNKLKKEKVFSGHTQILESFEKYSAMRNKHFIHDENGMLQTTAFLLISSAEDHLFGGLPSVVWNKAELDYYSEGSQLQLVMQFIWKYLVSEIDRIGAKIEEHYKDSSKEDLLKLGAPNIILASPEAPKAKR